MVEYPCLAGSTTMPNNDFVSHRQRIINDITEQIDAGTLKPGDKLPSTRELAERYGVAPTTVRDAVGRLLDRGVLRGHQGVGVFIAE